MEELAALPPDIGLYVLDIDGSLGEPPEDAPTMLRRGAADWQWLPGETLYVRL